MAPPSVSTSPEAGPVGRRLLSLDAIRGLAIVGMLLVNDTGDKAATPAQLLHSEWQGLTAADVVFPLFLFAVGTAMPFSRKAASGRSVVRRVALLVGIGSLLVSAKYRHLGPSTGVLQHIAAAYLFGWLLLKLPRRMQPVVAAGLLVAWMAAYAGTGYASGGSAGERFDIGLLGNFGAEGPHAWLPSAVSVYGGVLAGRVLAARVGGCAKLGRLLVLGAAALAAGAALAWLGVPVNKHLWTASYVLITTGLCTLVLATSYQLIDRVGLAAPARPLLALGANAIAVYVVTTLLFSALLRDARSELVAPLQHLGGPTFGALAYAGVAVLLAWGMCEALYRRRIFLKL